MAIVTLNHEKVFNFKKAELVEKRENVLKLESQITSLKVQLAVFEADLLKRQTSVMEVEKSLEFSTGLLTALNEVFDVEVEKAKQSGFEEGYIAHKTEIKNPKKPLPKKVSVRKSRAKLKK
jgi:hypothetical protein